MEKYITLNPVMKSFLAGSASGTCSSLFFQPLDLVKTRLQQNVSQQRPKIGGSIAVVRAVVSGSERGILALWTGLVPSITRTVPGVGLYFGSIEALKDLRAAAADSGDSSSSANWMAGDFALGVLARCISASVMNPVSVVKTRFESAAHTSGGDYAYRGVGHALASICRLEGARGLTCGLAPTIFRDAPYSGFYFMFYTQLKESAVVSSVAGEEEGGSGGATSRLVLAKLAAGAAACAVTHPADVVKTQMQLYPRQSPSLTAAAQLVWRRSGANGFAAGFAPRALRRTLVTALAWTIYEKVMAKEKPRH